MTGENGLAPTEPRRGVPATGDVIIDAVVADLAAVAPSDLDAILAAGQAVQRTLGERLADLGG